MQTRMLHTKPLVDALMPQLQAAAAALPVTPHMAGVLVGDDPASVLYQGLKKKFIDRMGGRYTLHRLPADTRQAELLRVLQQLNQDPDVHGIILQLPLPAGLDATEALNTISPEKDIDGLTDANWQGLQQQNPATLLPATPLGVLRLLDWANVPLKGQQVVVVGRSRLVGGPLAELLRQRGALLATFSRENPIDVLTMQQADVVISAAGCANLITKDMVKPGATVIDVGINTLPEPVNGKKVVGDAAAEELVGFVAQLTPVPGGVGRMTVLSLVTNLIDAAAMQQRQPRPVWAMPLLAAA